MSQKWAKNAHLVDKFGRSPLDLRSNPCNNYRVHRDESGGVSIWQRFGFKRASR